MIPLGHEGYSRNCLWLSNVFNGNRSSSRPLVLPFGIAQYYLKAEVWGKHIRKNMLWVRLLGKCNHVLAILSGDVMSKNKSLNNSDATGLPRVTIHFPSKSRCFWREHSVTWYISDMSTSEMIVMIELLRGGHFKISPLRTIFPETLRIKFGFLQGK